jgi:hypothetical protein
MKPEITVFVFADSVCMREVDNALQLAHLATNLLYGTQRGALQTSSTVSPQDNTCRIDTSHEVGQSLALIFAGYVRRQFGDAAVKVERTTLLPIQKHEEGGRV